MKKSQGGNEFRGTLTLNSGTICNNFASHWGGGVYVNIQRDSFPPYDFFMGNFYMNDGIICGNIAGQTGGGVVILGEQDSSVNPPVTMMGIFKKTKGTIYGRDASTNGFDAILQNEDEYGRHALYMGDTTSPITRNDTIWPDEPLDY